MINIPQQIQSKALLTPRQAAEYLGIKENTLAVWRCNKRYPLAHVKVGRSVKYRESDLDAFVELRTIKQ